MKELDFTIFPDLATERLKLRRLKDSDAPVLFTLRSDERVNRYIARTPPANVHEASSFILKLNEGIEQNKWIYWAICLKDDSRLIGTICLWNFSDDKLTAELGYELSPEFHRQGIMNEAVLSVIDFGSRIIGLNKIEAYTHKENEASAKLLLKNGFKPEWDRKDKDNKNNVIYALTF